MIAQSSSFPNKSPLYERLKDLMNYSELKRLVYSLLAIQQKKRFRTLAVLSAFPGEGKSLFCATMAMAYVETCRSPVLVVDATTYHNPNSLVLKDCLDPSNSQIDFVSMSERQMERDVQRAMPTDDGNKLAKPLMDAVVMDEDFTRLTLTKESDHALIRKVAAEGSKHYGLVLLDTVSLAAKNKSNIDPLLVASLSDASVLMVSRKLLAAPDMRSCLKALEDPALHLIGMIGNEEFVQ